MSVNVYDKQGNDHKLVNEADLSNVTLFINPSGNDYIDADNMRSTGIYRIYSTDTNLPVSNPNGLMLVFFHASSTFVQLFVSFSGETYIRCCWYGTFSTWKKLNNS